MQTLICYSSDSRAYIKWLESGRPDEKPSDVPFRLPDEAKKGDRYLLYVGGVDKSYVGWGTVLSNWRAGTKGWVGRRHVHVADHIFRDPIAGDDVFAATGFKLPRTYMVVNDSLATAVWRSARGKPLSQTDRAIVAFAELWIKTRCAPTRGWCLFELRHKLFEEAWWSW